MPIPERALIQLGVHSRKNGGETPPPTVAYSLSGSGQQCGYNAGSSESNGPPYRGIFGVLPAKSFRLGCLA